MCQQPLFVLRLPHLIESVHSLIWGIASGNGTIHNLEQLGTHFYERLLIHLLIYLFSILGAQGKVSPTINEL